MIFSISEYTFPSKNSAKLSATSRHNLRFFAMMSYGIVLRKRNFDFSDRIYLFHSLPTAPPKFFQFLPFGNRGTLSSSGNDNLTPPSVYRSSCRIVKITYFICRIQQCPIQIKCRQPSSQSFIYISIPLLHIYPIFLQL